MTIRLHRGDLPDLFHYQGRAVAVDTETMGLEPHRDRLCVVQLSPGDGTADVVQIPPGTSAAPNLTKLLADGTILKSQAQLVASRAASWTDAAHSAFAKLLDVVEARSRAKSMRLLRVAPGPEGADPMIARAAELGCKLASAAEGALLELYCPEEKVFSVCAALQNLFGGAIGVFEADFLFERPNAAFDAFRTALKR